MRDNVDTATVAVARRYRPDWAKIALLAFLILSLFLAWRYTPLADVMTADRLLAWARFVGGVSWSPLVVMAVFTPAAFLMFPRLLITLFAVIAYGPLLGFGTAMIGLVGAALSAYYAGRALPVGALRSIAGAKFDRTSRALRGHGVLATSLVRVVPVAPSVVVGMVAGAARIKLWQYLLGSALGMTPGALVATVFADQLAKALEDTSRVNYWLVGGVVALLILLTLVLRHWVLKLRDT